MFPGKQKEVLIILVSASSEPRGCCSANRQQLYYASYRGPGKKRLSQLSLFSLRLLHNCQGHDVLAMQLIITEACRGLISCLKSAQPALYKMSRSNYYRYFFIWGLNLLVWLESPPAVNSSQRSCRGLNRFRRPSGSDLYIYKYIFQIGLLLGRG